MALPKILVVDDTPTERRLMGKWLERQGRFSVEYAADGLEALNWLRSHKADLVLTDMQMPNMDGLQLVTSMRDEFPRTPVILITAHGSEELASRALQRGAASYVPKSRFKQLLVGTVHHVLDMSVASSSYARSFQYSSGCDVQFLLPNDAECVGPLVETLQTMVGSMSVCDATGRLQVGIALEQAILNAIYHGNLEFDRADRHGVSNDVDLDQLAVTRRDELPYRDRRVHVLARISAEEARFVVRDEGPGFDVQKLIKIPIAASLVDPQGRGLVLMWALMDKVTFNRTGNQITLVKRRERADQQQHEEGQDEGIAETEIEKLPGELGRLIRSNGQPPILLDRPQLTIGRDPSCDIVIHDARVSRRHCLLFVYSGWWYAKSLSESNIMRVDESIVSQSRLPPGAILSVAEHDFEIAYDTADLDVDETSHPVAQH